MGKILKFNEMDDFTREIAKDLFNRLPKNLTESDFLDYMKEKGSSDSISREVLGHLKSMRFPFTIETPAYQNNFDDDDFDDDHVGNYSSNPSHWYFDVYFPNRPEEGPACVALSMEPAGLDDQLGSHNLPIEIKRAISACDIYADSELMESIWEVKPNSIMTKDQIISAMISKGFNHVPGLAS